MCGLIVFTAIGIIIISVISHLMNIDIRITVYAPLFAMIIMMISMGLSKKRLESMAEIAWQELINIDPDLDNAYDKSFFMTNSCIFIPQIYNFYRFSPMLRGEAGAEAVWVQFCGYVTIGFSIWYHEYQATALAILIILLNYVFFRYPAIFYTDSHRDNIKRCWLNYNRKIKKDCKESKNSIFQETYNPNRYTEGVAQIAYERIISVVEEKHKNSLVSKRPEL